MNTTLPSYPLDTQRWYRVESEKDVLVRSFTRWERNPLLFFDHLLLREARLTIVCEGCVGGKKNARGVLCHGERESGSASSNNDRFRLREKKKRPRGGGGGGVCFKAVLPRGDCYTEHPLWTAANEQHGLREETRRAVLAATAVPKSASKKRSVNGSIACREHAEKSTNLGQKFISHQVSRNYR